MVRLRLAVCFCILVGMVSVASAAEKDFGHQFSLISRGDHAVNLGKSMIDMNTQDLIMSIDRDLLEKPLLFLPTIVTYSTPEPEPYALGTKRVFFKLMGNKLYLFESMERQVISGPFTPEKIIAEFPVIAQDDHRVQFDFKAGFDRIIMGASAGASSPDDIALPVAASYLRDPIVENDLFGVTHVVQVEGRQPETVTFNYSFIPDRVPLFSPIPAAEKDEHRVGYFLTYESFERGTGMATRYISRWDISKPIVFSLSANTPPEFRDAVREGLESWNEVFGRQVIVVQEAPEGVMFGDPRYNVFQWVENDNAWAAYADWHVHPLTGQILRANIYFPSSWVVSAKGSAQKLLDILTAEDREGDNANRATRRSRFGLRGFTPSILCDFKPDIPLRHLLENVVSGEISEEQLPPLLQRIVKTVVMHEMGHDLGLRHNFAGSMATEIFSLRDDLDLTNLLLTGERDHQAPLPSSSVMDYSDIGDDLRMERPGSYDRAAIRWAYVSSPEERETMQLPPFCTDQDTVMDADCQWWDAWAEPIDWYRTFDAVREVRFFNRKLLEELQGESEGRLRSLWRWDLERLMNYAGGWMNVRDLGGRSADERIARAAEGIASFLFSGDATSAPAGAIVTTETLVKRDTFNAEITSAIMRAHDETVDVVLSMIRDQSGTLEVADAARTPLLQSLVNVAANAGIRAWFADADENRRTATELIAREPGERGQGAQENLRQKLNANIKIFMGNANEPGAQEKIAFEQELLAILPSSQSRQP